MEKLIDRSDLDNIRSVITSFLVNNILKKSDFAYRMVTIKAGNTILEELKKYTNRQFNMRTKLSELWDFPLDNWDRSEIIYHMNKRFDVVIGRVSSTKILDENAIVKDLYRVVARHIKSKRMTQVSSYRHSPEIA